MCFYGLLALLLGARFGSTDAVFQRLLDPIDVDGNGTIDAAEYARVDEVGPFSAVDTDGDGAVTVAELGQWVRVTQPRPDTHGARPAQALLSGAVDRTPAPKQMVPSRPERQRVGQSVSQPASGVVVDPDAESEMDSRPMRLLLFGVGIVALGLGVGAWSGRRSRRRR